MRLAVPAPGSEPESLPGAVVAAAAIDPSDGSDDRGVGAAGETSGGAARIAAYTSRRAACMASASVQRSFFS